MERSEVTQALGLIPAIAKPQLCAGLCHELTIIGRVAYDGEQSDYERRWLRTVNELQHRITGVLIRLLNEPAFSPDDALVSFFLGERGDKVLEQHLKSAFERVTCSYAEAAKEAASHGQ